MNIVFKEWLPDQPDLGNPGLTVATNVIPRNGHYQPFETFSPNAATLPAAPIGVYAALSNLDLYAGTSTNLYISSGGGAFTNKSAATYGASNGWHFAEYENLIIATATGVDPQKRTMGSSSNFSQLSADAPTGAQAVGVIGRFVVLGNYLSSPYSIRWSGIDNPTSFPTPSSTTATAQQSGEQVFDEKYGEVTVIGSGDQFGLVSQTYAIYRVTYVGPPVVFQFDKITDNIGVAYPNSMVKANGLYYFATDTGFYVCDGVQVVSISDGKCSQFFSQQNPRNSAEFYLYGAADIERGIIIWGLPSASAITKLFIYSFVDKRWTYVDNQSLKAIYDSPSSLAEPNRRRVRAINSSNIDGGFSATAGTAVLETGDMEFNEGGRSYLDAWKPNVESSGTAPAITGRIGYRDSLSTAPSYTSTTSAFARTGVMNARVDAQYMRIETRIVGNFTKAVGVECDPQPSSMA